MLDNLTKEELISLQKEIEAKLSDIDNFYNQLKLSEDKKAVSVLNKIEKHPYRDILIKHINCLMIDNRYDYRKNVYTHHPIDVNEESLKTITKLLNNINKEKININWLYPSDDFLNEISSSKDESFRKFHICGILDNCLQTDTFGIHKFHDLKMVNKINSFLRNEISYFNIDYYLK